MKPLIFAGPCGVLQTEQMEKEVEFLSQFKDDCHLVIRAGAWKGQLYPNKKMVHGKWIETKEEYQGMGAEGILDLANIEVTHGIETCSEIMDDHQMAFAWGRIKWGQIGARHMGNLPLLREMRGWSNPVLLKRGMGNTITEWLGAREHLLYQSENRVVLCERGISTFETTDPRIRWRPDLLAVAQIKADYGHEIIVDCSHSVGRRDLVLPTAKAAMAMGADGVMIEVMEDPDKSMTDAAQGVNHEMFKRIMGEIL